MAREGSYLSAMGNAGATDITLQLLLRVSRKPTDLCVELAVRQTLLRAVYYMGKLSVAGGSFMR